MDWHEPTHPGCSRSSVTRRHRQTQSKWYGRSEQIFAGARTDPHLLDHLATASICALAYRD